MMPISSSSSSSISRTSAGMDLRPASLAARQRRSPAMIWYLPLSFGSGRTSIACSTPLLFSESASSFKAASSNERRGWAGLRRISSISISFETVARGLPPSVAGTAPTASISPIRADRPRPRRDGLLFASSDISFRPLSTFRAAGLQTRDGYRPRFPDTDSRTARPVCQRTALLKAAHCAE